MFYSDRPAVSAGNVHIGGFCIFHSAFALAPKPVASVEIFPKSFEIFLKNRLKVINGHFINQSINQNNPHFRLVNVVVNFIIT